MAQAAPTRLPDYETPPVIEVVCGVTFKSLGSILVPHVGLLWDVFKTDYPGCEEKPPLAPVLESFGQAPKMTWEVTDVPPLPRLWFVSRDETKLIQFQRDRFLHNWKKVQAEDAYPRYHVVKRMFREAFERFEAFLADRRLGTVAPLQYELKYVNHVPLGEGWSHIGEIGEILPDLAWRRSKHRFLPVPEALNWHTTFVLPERAGRLHVAAQTATRTTDQREIIILDLTVRGMPADASREAMYSWLDVAREWIVLGFADLTGEDMQRTRWRRKR